jgi:c-di-GMP-binding flagellar brake protein YcgR
VIPESKGRLDPRIPLKLRMDVQYPPGTSQWNRTETVDISTSGAYVRCKESLPLKAQVGCRLYLPPAGDAGEKLIDMEAVIVRVDPPERGSVEWRYALFFLGISESDLESLRRFVYAVSR